MNQKLKSILTEIAQQNPALKINVDELCKSSAEDGNYSDGEDGDDV